MTIKEISKFTKVSDRTIRRHIKLLFPGEMKRGQTTNLSDKQFEKLLEAMKTKGIIMQTGQIAEVTGQIACDRIERVIESMNNLANAIFAHVKIQDSKISALERKFQKRVDALPAPVISARNEINRIVREQVEAGEYDYRDKRALCFIFVNMDTSFLYSRIYYFTMDYMILIAWVNIHSLINYFVILGDQAALFYPGATPLALSNSMVPSGRYHRGRPLVLFVSAVI